MWVSTTPCECRLMGDIDFGNEGGKVWKEGDEEESCCRGLWR